MTDEPILLSEDRGGIRLLALNRPRQMNALNAALTAAIVAASIQMHVTADDIFLHTKPSSAKPESNFSNRY